MTKLQSRGPSQTTHVPGRQVLSPCLAMVLSRSFLPRMSVFRNCASSSLMMSFTWLEQTSLIIPSPNVTVVSPAHYLLLRHHSATCHASPCDGPKHHSALVVGRKVKTTLIGGETSNQLMLCTLNVALLVSAGGADEGGHLFYLYHNDSIIKDMPLISVMFT